MDTVNFKIQRISRYQVSSKKKDARIINEYKKILKWALFQLFFGISQIEKKVKTNLELLKVLKWRKHICLPH